MVSANVYKGGVLLKTIGIIAPKKSRDRKEIFSIFKPDFIFNEKHLVRFIIAYDNQNYNRIFKKYKAKISVCAANAVLKKAPSIKICDGKQFFEKNLMYFIVKSFKYNGLNSETATISFVFDTFTTKIESLVIQASKLFRYIVFVTDNNIENDISSLMNEYGIDIVTVPKSSIVCSDVSAELTDDKINYLNETIVINIDSNISIPKEYNISMPKNIGFNVNKLALAEALSIILQNDWHLMLNSI